MVRGIKEKSRRLAPVASATVIKPYDAGRDAANYNAEGKFYIASPGEFFLFFPGDAHRPNIKVDGYDTVKKLVIKIRYTTVNPANIQPYKGLFDTKKTFARMRLKSDIVPTVAAKHARMKKIQLFRNFLWFPIISIILFNITFKIQDKSYHVPQVHYIILIALIVVFLATFLFSRRS